MKINWNQNPFLTSVEIDERDEQMILVAIQNEKYTSLLCNLDMELDGKFNWPALTDLDEIKRQVDRWSAICNLEIDSEEVQMYIYGLSTPHMGDCTCVPCSCIRCQVEEMLGINTLQGLGKHQAYKVQGAFGKEGSKSIDEAINSLNKPYTIENRSDSYRDYSEEDYNNLLVRWNSERESAIRWLQQYRERHGF